MPAELPTAWTLAASAFNWTPDVIRAERPAPDLAAVSIELDGMRGSRFVVRGEHGDREVKLPLPGLYNVYNALAAAAAATALGVG